MASEAERICTSRLEHRRFIEPSLDGVGTGRCDESSQCALSYLARPDNQGDARVTDGPADC